LLNKKADITITGGVRLHAFIIPYIWMKRQNVSIFFS
jgi:hypothetical protein